MSENGLKVLGVDPGVTTGLSMWCGKHTSAWQVGPVRGFKEEVEVAQHIARLVWYEHVDVIAMESFTLHQQYAGRSGVSADPDAVSPIRIIQSLMTILVMAEYDVDKLVSFHSSSQAKGVITDARLRRWGAWVPGKKHAMDARRHVCLFLKEAGYSMSAS